MKKKILLTIAVSTQGVCYSTAVGTVSIHLFYPERWTKSRDNVSSLRNIWYYTVVVCMEIKLQECMYQDQLKSQNTFKMYFDYYCTIKYT